MERTIAARAPSIFGDYTLEPPSINPQQARQFEKEFDLRMKEAQDLSKNLARSTGPG